MYKFNKVLFEKEMTEFYKTLEINPYDNIITNSIREKWESEITENMSSYKKKSILYRLIGEMCEVKLFKSIPFYFYLDTGLNRNTWGLFGGAGNIMLEKYREHREYIYGSERPMVQAGREHELVKPPIDLENYYRLISCSDFIDWDHQCVGYDNVFKYGYLGLIEKAKKRIAQGVDDEQKDFLSMMIEGLKVMVKVGEKFSLCAAEMLKSETDSEIIAIYEKIKVTASRVPANPPSDFYEAVAAIWFSRDMVFSVDGMGISMYGQMDRLLYPFYKKDLEEGKITYAEAKDYLKAMLYITDFRWPVHEYGCETSTTVIIGGCDREGNVVYNPVTKMICENFVDLNIIGTKLNARVCKESPKEYLEDLSKLYMAGVNSLVIMNDEAMIPSETFNGKDIHDARLYVAGGCYEPLIANCEINYKAFQNINLAQLFRNVFNRQNFDSYEEFYKKICDELEDNYSKITEAVAKRGQMPKEINPSGILSATIDNSIEKGMDAFVGGAKYNQCSINAVGLGTFIDSIYSVKEVIYTQKLTSKEEMKKALDSNWVGYEDLYLMCKHLPKFGHENSDVQKLAKEITEEIVKVSTGKDNGRMGKTECSFFVHYSFNCMGSVTGATPDGRHAWDNLSRSSSPSEWNQTSITSTMNDYSILPNDKVPGCSVLETMMQKTKNVDNIVALIKTFIEKKGNMLQMSLISTDELKAAKKEPEKYGHLSVRLCGFSAYFVTLTPQQQDEVISRAAF